MTAARDRLIASSCLLASMLAGCGRSPLDIDELEPELEPEFEVVPRCQDGEFVPEGPTRAYDVEVLLTVDDSWNGFVDGFPIVDALNPTDWRRNDRLLLSLESGCHTVAINGRDASGIIAGFIATVTIDDTVTHVTGDGSWRVTGVDPGAGWGEIDYPYVDSAWSVPPVCEEQEPWGPDWPELYFERGATWIWDDANCRSLGEAWFRLDFGLP